MEPIDVAVGVIHRPDGAYLLGRRPAGKVYAGWWEFPGGKVEVGERPRDAVVRELNEELGIEVERADPWLLRTFTYPHASVRLHFFRIRRWSGEPVPREHEAIRWQRPGDPVASPMLPANAPVLAALALPNEYAITCAQALGTARMLELLEHRLMDGLRLFQIREPGLAPGLLRPFAERAVALAHRHGARVTVSADPDLARALGADGVHLPARELRACRERPPGLLLAASCHDGEELRAAMRLELDFAVLGSVRATPSHPDAAPLGWERFAVLAQEATLPIYAIGGMTPDALETAWGAGAHGIAMIRGSWVSPPGA